MKTINNILGNQTEVPSADNLVGTQRVLNASSPSNNELLEDMEEVVAIPTVVTSSSIFPDDPTLLPKIETLKELLDLLTGMLIRFDTVPKHYQKSDFKVLTKIITESLIFLYTSGTGNNSSNNINLIGTAQLDTDPLTEALELGNIFPGIYFAQTTGNYIHFGIILSEEDIKNKLVLFIPNIENNAFVNYSINSVDLIINSAPEIYVGSTAPTSPSIKIWIDTTEVVVNNDVEILRAIRDANPQSTQLAAMFDESKDPLLDWYDHQTGMGASFDGIRCVSLKVNGFSLTSLDIQGLDKLRYLGCGGNNLTSLVVEGLTSISVLICNNCMLTTLDVNGLPLLDTFICSGNALTELHMEGVQRLAYFSCYNNQLTSLDLSSLRECINFSCGNNQLTSLDLAGITGLELLDCAENQLTTLDVSTLTDLGTISCGNNLLTSLDLSNQQVLRSIICHVNQLSALDISNLHILEGLYCSSNQITALNITGLTTLKIIQCGFNQISSLNVSGLPLLEYLDCTRNMLTSLVVSGLANLTDLRASENKLSSVNLSGLTSLSTLMLGIQDPGLTSIDITGLTALTTLILSSNLLMEIPSITAIGNLAPYSYDFTYNSMPTTETDRLIALGFDSQYVLPQNTPE